MTDRHVADDFVESDCDYCGVEPHSDDCPRSADSLTAAVIDAAALLADSWSAMRHLHMAAGTNDTLRGLLDKLATALKEQRRG